MATQTLTQSQRQRWIARTISTIAASQGITQQRDLARVVGWNETRLSRKLHQEVKFSLEDVDQVAAALEVDTAELLNGWNGRVPVPDEEVVVPFRRLADNGTNRPDTCEKPYLRLITDRTPDPVSVTALGRVA